MVEKPEKQAVEKDLLVDEKCYATFGQYILTDEIFDNLESQIYEQTKQIETKQAWKEVDLTSALRQQAIKGGVVGVDIAGLSYDVGIPSMYYKTFCEFGR